MSFFFANTLFQNNLWGEAPYLCSQGKAEKIAFHNALPHFSPQQCMNCWWNRFAKYFFPKQLSFTEKAAHKIVFQKKSFTIEAKLCQTGHVHRIVLF
jgi:hypothetical protein